MQTYTFAQSFFISFEHYCENKVVEFNKLQYKNAYNSQYAINQIQYFISNISVHTNYGWVVDSTVTYIDAEKTSPVIKLSAQRHSYIIDSVRFTFGIPLKQNKSYQFTDPERAGMYWPEVLGGGYHYMKTNITFQDTNNSLSYFNCHLGQSLSQDTTIDNSITITLPCHYQFTKKDVLSIIIQMNVDKWFTSSYIVNFNNFTHGIMNNQDVMQKICNNGFQVFQLK